jgi:hypothetical protein
MKGPKASEIGFGDDDGPRPVSPADAFQWVFNLDLCLKGFGRMVSAPYLYKSLIDLRTAVESGNAHEVRLAWQMILDVAGPMLTGMFIREGGWKEVCPVPYGVSDTPSQCVVWENYEKRVIARLQYRNDEAVDIAFVEE